MHNRHLPTVASEIQRVRGIVGSSIKEEFLHNRSEYRQCYECGSIFLKTYKRCPICKNDNLEEWMFLDPVLWTDEYRCVSDEIKQILQSFWPESEENDDIGMADENMKKELLKERGIEYKTLEEMNPFVIFY